MTFRVFKSQIANEPDFAARVDRYRQARLDHHKTIGVSAPTEHYLIEACVRRVSKEGEVDQWAVDYEIVDDTPPPGIDS